MKILLAGLLFASPVSAGSYMEPRHWDTNTPSYQHHNDSFKWWRNRHTSQAPDSSSTGHSLDRKCYRQEYREEYTPGTAKRPGYIRSWHDKIEVPCRDGSGFRRRTTIEYDNNDCSDGKIAGGILGGAAGAALSRGDGRWWAIPLGVVTGATIGCDIDGG